MRNNIKEIVMKVLFFSICISILACTNAHAMEEEKTQEKTNVSTSTIYSCSDRITKKDTLREYYYIKKSDIKKLADEKWQETVRNSEKREVLLSQELYSTHKDEKEVFWSETKFGYTQDTTITDPESNSWKGPLTFWTTPIKKELPREKALQLICILKLYHEKVSYPKTVFNLYDAGVTLLIQDHKEKNAKIEELSQQCEKQQPEIKQQKKDIETITKELEKLKEVVMNPSKLIRKESKVIDTDSRSN
jgi:hypothetical protein